MGMAVLRATRPPPCALAPRPPAARDRRRLALPISGTEDAQPEPPHCQPRIGAFLEVPPRSGHHRNRLSKSCELRLVALQKLAKPFEASGASCIWMEADRPQ